MVNKDVMIEMLQKHDVEIMWLNEEHKFSMYQKVDKRKLGNKNNNKTVYF